ncbi:hypothetical protein SEMRO_144_G067090.1 [Seminavis robusta]|uniref:Uncharacterized protein n=1 Tax=Seminavis robusta TaxID=568900 RepID=A0A9N8H804_9STRA|nr:hypothetical protein SEMRO_144_G067090.1 [Seminavis robusta]|eukprot:Sro144_g067090.1 n/a (275) ;mRNA; r:80028-80852
MQMQTSQDVARRNHHAISLLLKGAFDESLVHSHTALNTMQGIIDLPRWAPPGADDDAMNLDDQEEEPLLTHNVWSIELSPAHDSLPLAYQGSVAFFNRALAFEFSSSDDNDGQSEENTFHQDLTLAAVVLYNAGLCHHVRAIQSAKFQTPRLQKALQMYTMASCLLSNAASANDNDDDLQNNDAEDNDLLNFCSRDEGGALLVMALLNNMAHIHAVFADRHLESGCIEAMNSFFESFCMRRTDEELEVTQEDLLLLNMSSSLYQAESFAGCPAA